MNTLCIPVGPENASLRANTINKMDLIYAGARDVLVLDPEFQQISLDMNNVYHIDSGRYSPLPLNDMFWAMF